MRKLFLFACAAFILASCNTKTEESEVTASDSTKMAGEEPAGKTYDYPYTLDKPYRDWRPGDQQNAVNFMKGLKAWENNNIAESASYFGDSVELYFDNYERKLSKDSLPAFLSYARDQYASVNIKMKDWESVISKDGTEEWVTVWYDQTSTTKDGKTESLAIINDAKFVNGKVVLMEEAVRRKAKQ